MDIIKGIDNNAFNSIKSGKFLVICDALRDLVAFVQFKIREKHPWRSVNRATHHICVIRQFRVYFIGSALITYLVILPSNPMSHNLAHLDQGDQCFSFAHIFLHYENKKAAGCITRALKRSN